MALEYSGSGRGPERSPKSDEQIREELRRIYLEEHKGSVKENDGQRILIVKEGDGYITVCPPKGLCIEGKLDQEYMKAFQRYVIPYRVNTDSKFYWDARERRKKAQKSLEINDPLYIALPNEEGEWISGYINREDLLVEDPQQLLDESDVAINDSNLELAKSKSLAYLAITPESLT